jgi:hypothetical protein
LVGNVEAMDVFDLIGRKRLSSHQATKANSCRARINDVEGQQAMPHSRTVDHFEASRKSKKLVAELRRLFLLACWGENPERQARRATTGMKRGGVAF